MASPKNHPTIVPPDTVLPPPPPGVRHVRVPMLGIVIATDRRRRRVDRFFHWPMIILALAILPLLVIEMFVLGEREPGEPLSPMRLAVIIGFGIIWLAFVVEFFVKIAIAESRVEYVRRNWLDVVIILVPILRPFRAARAARTAHVFKLRGVGMKFARYVFTMVVGMDATERFLDKVGLKRRVGRKNPEHMTRHELQTEVRQLRRLTDRWEDWYELHEEHVEEQGGACVVAPKPHVAPDDEPGVEPCDSPSSTVTH